MIEPDQFQNILLMLQSEDNDNICLAIDILNAGKDDIKVTRDNYKDIYEVALALESFNVFVVFYSEIKKENKRYPTYSVWKEFDKHKEYIERNIKRLENGGYLQRIFKKLRGIIV